MYQSFKNMSNKKIILKRKCIFHFENWSSGLTPQATLEQQLGVVVD